MPTARNARGIDLVIYETTGRNFLGIQVKALSKRSAVPLGNSLKKVMGDYWVIAIKVRSEPICFVVTPDEVVQYSKRTERNGRVSYWLEATSYDLDDFREAWNKIRI